MASDGDEAKLKTYRAALAAMILAFRRHSRRDGHECPTCRAALARATALLDSARSGREGE